MPHYVRPKKIYQYQVLDLLGKGGNGVVYKGIDMQNGTFVAIKQIIIQKQDIKSLKFEINVLKDLNDPYIVKYIDAFQINNKIYLILEYLEGGSLGSLVQKAPLEQNLVRKFIKQILKGLEYLHKHHVAHRDLKGTNILLTKEGKAKITDFGVAIQVNDTQKTLSSAGTPYWMAPEAVSSEGQTSVQCDIWSLGCTIIQLLTGNPPYHNLMPFPALMQIVEDQHPPLPNNASPLCKDFLLKCFIKDPKLRSKAHQLLKHRWIKQQSQANSSSFNVDIQNLVIQNQKKIQQLILTQNWNELYEASLKTTNKKTLYLNPHFPKINNTKNSDQKLKFLRQIVLNNFQALKYLSSIRIFKKLFQKEIKDDFKITKMKGLDFVFDCYELCEENNQIIIFTDDFMIYVQLVLDHIVTNPSEWSFRTNHIIKIVQILFRAVHSNLLIENHLHYILEQHQIFVKLLELSNFIIDTKNPELVFNFLTILKKNISYGENPQKYIKSIQKISELHINQYDIRVLFQNISLIQQISKKSELQKTLQQSSYLQQICSILLNLSKAQKITISQQQIVLQLIGLLLVLFKVQDQKLKKERIRKFFKIGGFKAINSIGGQFLKNDKILEEIQKVIQLLDQ